MDFRSIASDLFAGVSSLGRHNYADKLPDTEIHGGIEIGSYWEAGFASAEIVPDDLESKKYYIAGYHENNPAQGVIDPQTVGVLYLSDSTKGGGHLFISVDAVGLLKNDVDRIRKSLEVFCNNAGISSVSVFCSHDHAGIDTLGLWGKLPRSGKSSKFMTMLFSACYNCAIKAFKARKQGRLYFGSVEVPDMQQDVRSPEVYSKTLSRFRFSPEDGSNDILFVNFAAHAETLQAINSYISADYPGYMRRRIKEATNADTLFSNGAVGGMITMKIENEEELRETGSLLEETIRIGEKLADYALSVSDERELKPAILCAKREFFAEVDNTVLSIAFGVGIVNAERYDIPYSNSKAVKSEISYYEIGGVPLLAVPGELFPELAYGGYLDEFESATSLGPNTNPIPLTEICGRDDLIIIGLCNDEIGYIIPPNDFLLNDDMPFMEKAIDNQGRRHYEETNSLGEGTASALATAFSRLTQDLNSYLQEEI